jgi:hypothetical protein
LRQAASVLSEISTLRNDFTARIRLRYGGNL